MAELSIWKAASTSAPGDDHHCHLQECFTAAVACRLTSRKLQAA